MTDAADRTPTNVADKITAMSEDEETRRHRAEVARRAAEQIHNAAVNSRTRTQPEKPNDQVPKDKH